MVTKALKPREKPAHPRISEMVNQAIRCLHDRRGSSLMAIKKCIAVIYNLDSSKIAYFINKYLNKAVADGTLVRTKGKGANGSFKMPSAAVLAARRREAKALEGPPIKKVSKKPASAKKSVSEKTLVKKQESAKTAIKTSTDNGKPKSAKSAAIKTAMPSPKGKKITKTPTSKPKAPRPRKVIPGSATTKPAATKIVAKKAM